MYDVSGDIDRDIVGRSRQSSRTPVQWIIPIVSVPTACPGDRREQHPWLHPLKLRPTRFRPGMMAIKFLPEQATSHHETPERCGTGVPIKIILAILSQYGQSKIK